MLSSQFSRYHLPHVNILVTQTINQVIFHIKPSYQILNPPNNKDIFKLSMHTHTHIHYSHFFMKCQYPIARARNFPPYFSIIWLCIVFTWASPAQPVPMQTFSGGLCCLNRARARTPDRPQKILQIFVLNGPQQHHQQGERQKISTPISIEPLLPVARLPARLSHNQRAHIELNIVYGIDYINLLP